MERSTLVRPCTVGRRLPSGVPPVGSSFIETLTPQPWGATGTGLGRKREALEMVPVVSDSFFPENNVCP